MTIVDELEYSGEEDDTDGESSGSQPLLPDARRSSPSPITPSTSSNEGITASPSAPVRRRRPSLRGGRRRQQVARLSFVRKSPSRMLRPQLTSVSYTVRRDGRRRGRKTSRRPGRRRKQTQRPRTTTPLPLYDGQTLGDFCPSGRLVVAMSAVIKLSRCLGVDTDHWLLRTTMITPHWSVESISFLLYHVAKRWLNFCNYNIFKVRLV